MTNTIKSSPVLLSIEVNRLTRVIEDLTYSKASLEDIPYVDTPNVEQLEEAIKLIRTVREQLLED